MTENRIYNFSAGPSMIAEDVLRTAAAEMLNYHGSGMSVMEMSHRSKYFDEIINEAQAKLRRLMNIPEDYAVLFVQGGATTQFSMIALNLMNKNKTADYALTGQFAKKCYEEGKRYGDARIAFDGKPETYARIPRQDELVLNPEADFFHMCQNNTIYGTTWNYVPETGNVPVVADLSSCILSCPVDVTKYGVIYAGAQKNCGPAGMAIVIIRKDLMGNAQDITPVLYDYQRLADNNSMYNTPPTYGIYIFKLVLDWIESLGGLEVMEKRNREKAAILYDYLDQSKMFKSGVDRDSRSMMNVTFVTGNEELDAKFVKEAKAAGFENLKGHRSVGGMRASIYNAMPREGVEKLVAFMKEFEAANA